AFSAADRVFRWGTRVGHRVSAARHSADLETTRRRLPLRAVLFNRNAHDLREQRLDDQTGVRVMRRYRRKRTTLAANELLPVGLVKCDCSAQFLQQIKGGRESDVS